VTSFNLLTLDSPIPTFESDLAGKSTRRVGGRLAKPASRDHTRRVFTRRKRGNLHARAGRATIGEPASFYRAPLRVGLPSIVDPSQANFRRPST
jgi:hypothetical protein